MRLCGARNRFSGANIGSHGLVTMLVRRKSQNLHNPLSIGPESNIVHAWYDDDTSSQSYNQPIQHLLATWTYAKHLWSHSLFHQTLLSLSVCKKCVPGKGGLTCCGKGGSWHRRCGQIGDDKFPHTYDEGYRVCGQESSPKKEGDSPKKGDGPSNEKGTSSNKFQFCYKFQFYYCES